MPTIIVCTDFSDAARNALSYTCSLVKDKGEGEVDLLLLHVFNIPSNYSGEGLSIITINDELNDAQAGLEEELDWANAEFPGLSLRSKLTTGTLSKSLREQVDEEKPLMIVIGAGGHYGEMLTWDAEILDLLRGLPVPVLTVPTSVTFAPVNNIAFSCNLKNVTSATPFETLKSLVSFIGAELHVLFVTTPEIDKMADKYTEDYVHEKLDEISPVYHHVKEAKVVGAITHFVDEHEIGLLMVTPKRLGIWANVFHKSNTRELMRLNTIPILALHGK
jgi:nucleotide-binding universal stress UspA family protein